MEKPVTKLSRRNIIVGGGAVAAVGAIAASPLSVPIARTTQQLIATQTWARSLLSLADAGYEQWLAVVGSDFALGGGTSMRLIGVSAFPSPGARPMRVGRTSGFLAVFELAGGQTMAGDLIYTAAHSEYGPLPIFLSASSDPRTPARMYAVFN